MDGGLSRWVLWGRSLRASYGIPEFRRLLVEWRSRRPERGCRPGGVLLG